VYDVTTMGELPGLSGQAWPDIPPGWVPAGTPGLPGVPAPVPGPPSTRGFGAPPSTDGATVVAIGAGALVLGIVGMWAWGKYGKKSR
jgi:hypothetical protein